MQRPSMGWDGAPWKIVAGVMLAAGMGAASAHAADKKASGELGAKTIGGIAVQSPESVGFSSTRLENLHALIQGEVDRKELAGAITLLARHGKVVDFHMYGFKDAGAQAPMTYDTIFRDYSMSKPVTGAAMMILYEQGKWLPWDPISKYIPAFKGLKVFDGFDKSGKMTLAEPAHPPTIAELMSHSAGFSYGNGHGPVDALYRQAKPMQSDNLQQFVDRMAQLPLNFQPGQAWTYSASMDIEGYIVEKLSGDTLPDLCRSIFSNRWA